MACLYIDEAPGLVWLDVQHYYCLTKRQPAVSKTTPDQGLELCRVWNYAGSGTMKLDLLLVNDRRLVSNAG